MILKDKVRSKKTPIIRILNSFLAKFKAVIISKARLENYGTQLVEQLEGTLVEIGVITLPKRHGRKTLLAQLIGTSVCEGLYICQHLHNAALVKGDVCEFGVAQGATSALLANELLDTDRGIWLYDSFQGLPSPSEKDTLIDDIFDLGSIDKYEGTMMSPKSEVERRLKDIGFPKERSHLVVGFFNNSPEISGPDSIAFAYIDFDFYQPIIDALGFVNQRMPVGGCIIVDDYGFFSAGAKTAVDEFIAENKASWKFELPHEFCGKFCILTKSAEADEADPLESCRPSELSIS